MLLFRIKPVFVLFFLLSSLKVFSVPGDLVIMRGTPASYQVNYTMVLEDGTHLIFELIRPRRSDRITVVEPNGKRTVINLKDFEIKTLPVIPGARVFEYKRNFWGKRIEEARFVMPKDQVIRSEVSSVARDQSGLIHIKPGLEFIPVLKTDEIISFEIAQPPMYFTYKAHFRSASNRLSIDDLRVAGQLGLSFFNIPNEEYDAINSTLIENPEYLDDPEVLSPIPSQTQQTEQMIRHIIKAWEAKSLEGGTPHTVKADIPLLASNITDAWNEYNSNEPFYPWLKEKVEQALNSTAEEHRRKTVTLSLHTRSTKEDKSCFHLYSEILKKETEEQD